MRKIKLDLNDLHVRSFETQPTEDGEGTVHGHDSIIVRTQQQTCARQRSEYATCVVNCECTNRYLACKNPGTSDIC